MTLQVLLPLFCSCLVFAQHVPLEQAWDLLAKGQRSEAVHLLYEIIKANPTDADARLLLGSVLMEAGERSQSIEQLTQAVRLRPDSSQARNALGEAFNTFGDFVSARNAFEKAAKLDPNYAPAQVNLGLALIESGKFSLAGPHLDRAIQLLGQNSEAAYPRYLRAKIYSEQHQTEKAIAEQQRAVSLRPDFAEAWSDLGSARKILLDDAGALVAFEKAVRFAPKDPVAQERFGSELLSQGKAHEALPHLEEAVRLDAQSQTALYNLQRALLDDGHPEEAAAVKAKLTALLREKDQADQHAIMAIQLNNQGAALEKAGKLPEAFQKYQAASHLYPEHVGIRLNLAIALLRLGQYSQGIAELREVLERDPENLAAKKAMDEALAQAPPKTPR